MVERGEWEERGIEGEDRDKGGQTRLTEQKWRIERGEEEERRQTERSVFMLVSSSLCACVKESI